MIPPEIPPETPPYVTPADEVKRSAPPAGAQPSTDLPVAKRPSKLSQAASKAKTVLVGLLLLALGGGIGYGIATLQQQGQVQQIARDKAAADEAAQAALAEAERKVLAAEARSQLTKVQLRLLQSVDELEQRNFGNANTQLRLASETLSAVEVSQEPEQLAALKTELSTAEINFAVNPVEQRRLMLGYAEKIDALLPQP